MRFLTSRAPRIAAVEVRVVALDRTKQTHYCGGRNPPSPQRPRPYPPRCPRASFLQCRYRVRVAGLPTLADRLSRQSRLIRDTDCKAARPDQLDLLFDAGIQELEPFGEPGRRRHLEASSGCRQIDHRADNSRLFRLDN